MIIYAAQDYYEIFFPSFVAYGAVAGSSKIKRYPNGELYAIANGSVSGQDCLIIGTVAPPDEQLLGIMMLADAIGRNGAKTIQVFLPYLGYGRQDKPQADASCGIAMLGSMLKASGINKVITVDPHSELDRRLIGMPLAPISPAPVFAPKILELGWNDATVVAPDKGAIGRAKSLGTAIGYQGHQISYFTKEHQDGIAHTSLTGEVTRKIIIVDDILDSGQTLLSACKILHDKGAREIVIAVTHGCFRTRKWLELFELGVTKILVSDSCPEAQGVNHPNIEVVSLEPLLLDVLHEQNRPF